VKKTAKQNRRTSAAAAAFHILGLVAHYSLVPVFEGSSQKPLSFWLVVEKLEFFSEA